MCTHCHRYITVDKMYGHMEEDGTKFFIVAQSIINLLEGKLV
jgi:hypothetical protein